RLPRLPPGATPGRTRAARLSESEATRVHGALRVRLAGGAAPDAQRQGGPRSPAAARPGALGPRGGLRRPPERNGASAPAAVGEGARNAADRRARRLLRGRR